MYLMFYLIKSIDFFVNMHLFLLLLQVSSLFVDDNNLFLLCTFYMLS